MQQSLKRGDTQKANKKSSEMKAVLDGGR